MRSYTYAHTHGPTHIQYMHTLVFTCANIHTYAYLHTYTNKHTLVHIPTYIYVHTNMYIHLNTDVHAVTCTICSAPTFSNFLILEPVTIFTNRLFGS